MQVIKNTLLLTILILQSGCYLFFLPEPDKVTTSQLKEKYGISLRAGWMAKEADSLLETFDSIYQQSEDPDHNLAPSVWQITNKELQDDVQIESVNDVKHVTLSRDVFFSEVSEVEKSQEEPLLNKRLFRIIAQFVTENWTDIPEVRRILKDGTDRFMIELVLKEMYGLSIIRTGTPEAERIGQVLRRYGREARVSESSNEQLMMLMSVYEKFPKGLHNLGRRLKYLLINQQTKYAGSAWIGEFCVEYAGFIFHLKNRQEFHRIILHEKAHFLWEYTLNWDLRAEWAKIGGWRKDSNNRFGWSNNRSRKEFVTTYAGSKNPNEDWSESVAYYLLRPDKLRSCSLAKYEFIDKVINLYSTGGVPYEGLKLKSLINETDD